MNLFDSTEFKKWSQSLDAALQDSAKAPSLPCPACGQGMAHEIGCGRLTGYRCMGAGCVGFHISVEELSDSEKYRIIVTECLQRRAAREEMKRRNGAHDDEDRKAGDCWCSDCHSYHPPTAEHPACRLCAPGFIHAPAPADICFRDYKGWNFTPPFLCMCCGKEICFRQWAFARGCGACDTGACMKKRLHEMRDVVFYGNGEMVDAEEAERYRFTPDRMVKVPPGKSANWYQPRAERGLRRKGL